MMRRHVITAKVLPDDPPTPERPETTLEIFNVLSESIEGACEAVRASNPGCEIVEATQKEAIDYVWHY